jgi:PAS domain S-box-containing protein
MSIGTLSIISGGLQLIVPSYGLRLVRRFGAQSVGWFLVIAFASLALLHLVSPFRTDGTGGLPSLAQEAVCGIGSLLLLIGLGHLETICSARRNEERKEKDLCGQWQERVQSETAELTRHNRELTEAKTRCEQRLKVLQESEARFRLLFDDNPQAMFIFDLRTFRLLLANQAALQLYGFSAAEFASLNLQHLLSPALVSGVSEYAARPCSRVEGALRWQHQRRDHTLMDVEMLSLDLKYEGHPARLVLVNDIASQLRRETDARTTVRLETVGQIAGGFAHHFNNLLAIIEGSASLLTDKVTDQRSSEYLKNISGAVSRAAGLTKQLMVVGSRRQMKAGAVDLNGMLRNMNHLMRRLVGEEITIQNFYSAGLPPAAIDTQLTEQVIVNLVLNARDAMANGGTITISTAAVRRHDAPLAPDGSRHTGEFIRLSVRDTGCGMPPEVQAHLFEPFFTTKEIGRACGLGLASVYGAVRQQSGWLEFTSEVGKGTEFRIFLPCASGKAASQCQPQLATTLATILLIEPDDRSRGTARCVLNWNGYRVIEADGSSTAQMLWESQATNIDLLMVDAGFSDGVSGNELVSRFRQSKPNLKVVFFSSATSEEDAKAAQNSLQTVTKPFRSEALLKAIQSALAAGPASLA